MKNFFKLSCSAILALLGACSYEMPIEIEENEAEETNVCRMTFESSKPSFEGDSRANGDEWENGDCIYLKFIKPDESIVTGKATYDITDKIWNLEYTGVLSSVENAKCVACYFDDDVTEDMGYVDFSVTTGIYFGVGTYTKSANGVNVSATLYPNQSRIRFTGKPGTNFVISGPRGYVSYKPEKSTFYYVSTIESSINSDGSSPYIYLTVYNTDRVMTVSYGNLSFTMTCESPMLDDGKSGYMSLPTKESHNGWQMEETTVPTLGETSVTNVEGTSADFSASLLSNGNSTITDCGFVYSLAKNPTLENMSLKSSVSSFKATASNLSKNTTYYVRAYATNSVGTAYGPETSFTTSVGNISVKNGLTAYYMFEKDYEDASGNDKGGFGMGKPEFVAGVSSDSYALKLNSSSYMHVGSPLHFSKTHSVAFWVKDIGDGIVFGTSTNESGLPLGMSLEMQSGVLHYIVSLHNNCYQRSTTGKFTHPSLDDGKWHHLALVCEYKTSTGSYSWETILYIDTKKIDVTAELDTSPGKVTGSGVAFQIGGTMDYYSNTKSVDGAPMTIDNFRTYTRCLSADEIKEIYNSEK